MRWTLVVLRPAGLVGDVGRELDRDDLAEGLVEGLLFDLPTVGLGGVEVAPDFGFGAGCTGGCSGGGLEAAVPGGPVAAGEDEECADGDDDRPVPGAHAAAACRAAAVPVHVLTPE
jgi:hypothetical protein